MYKIYTLVDTVTKTGQRLFLANNDDEARREAANFHLNRKAINPFHDYKKYMVVCLGIYHYNANDDDIYIETNKDFPYNIDNLKDFFDPTMYDTEEFKQLQMTDEKRQEIMRQAKKEIEEAINNKGE